MITSRIRSRAFYIHCASIYLLLSSFASITATSGPGDGRRDPGYSKGLHGGLSPFASASKTGGCSDEEALKICTSLTQAFFDWKSVNSPEKHMAEDLVVFIRRFLPRDIVSIIPEDSSAKKCFRQAELCWIINLRREYFDLWLGKITGALNFGLDTEDSYKETLIRQGITKSFKEDPFLQALVSAQARHDYFKRIIRELKS